MVADIYQALTTCQARGQACDSHYLNEFSHNLMRLRVFHFTHKKNEDEKNRCAWDHMARNERSQGLNETSNWRTCALNQLRDCAKYINKHISSVLWGHRGSGTSFCLTKQLVLFIQILQHKGNSRNPLDSRS